MRGCRSGGWRRGPGLCKRIGSRVCSAGHLAPAATATGFCRSTIKASGAWWR